ncbi:ankyrin repeat domain-containing protein [Ruegeria arenilitoris]
MVDLPKLEQLVLSFEGFPNGVDPWIGRRWVISAIQSVGIQGVVWLLDQNVELKFRDEEGNTPLHACLDRENSDRYQLLQAIIAAGADVDEIGSSEYTPLHLAATRGDLEAIDILLAAGANPTIATGIDNFATPEEEARLCGEEEAADYLRKRVAKLPKKPKQFEGPFGLANLKELRQ